MPPSSAMSTNGGGGGPVQPCTVGSVPPPMFTTEFRRRARMARHPTAAPYCCTLLLHSTTAPYCCTLLLHPTAAPYCCTLLLHPTAAPYCCTLMLYPTAAPYCCTLLLHPTENRAGYGRGWRFFTGSDSLTREAPLFLFGLELSIKATVGERPRFCFSLPGLSHSRE